jgi:hypothetical protein
MESYEKKGYKSSVPLGTPMLMAWHIEMRLTWAQMHMHDDLIGAIQSSLMKLHLTFFEIRSVGGIKTAKGPSKDYQNPIKR